MGASLEGLEKKLTPKQRAFCYEYLIDSNAKAAAIRAGYSEKRAAEMGYLLLHKTTVSEFIGALTANRAAERIATADEVLETLTATMRRQNKENIVVTVMEEKVTYEPGEDGKMRRVVTKREVPQIVPVDAKLVDANKAAELLGKRYRLWTDKIDLGGAVPVVLAGDDEIPD